MAEDAVSGAEVEVEVWAGVLDDVRVAREAEGAHGFRLHEDLVVLAAGGHGGLRVEGGEDGDGGVDAGLELREGRFVVWEVGVWGVGYAGGEEFCRVGD